MDTKAVIIPGEASESDEESINVKSRTLFPLHLASNSCGTIIQGEKTTSEEETNSYDSHVVDSVTCSYKDVKDHKNKKCGIKYNSLLHKKLHECNKSFDKDIQDLLNNTIINAFEELTDTNKQLLKSEFIFQETVSKFKTASTQFENTLRSFKAVLDEDFFQVLKL